MRTPYNQDNAKFSNDAHLVAQKELYPTLFNTSDLSFEDTLVGTSEENDILDGKMGIDRLVNVGVRDLKLPLTFAIQERFRRAEYSTYRDITITEWNGNSNLPSELYKIKAGIFLYGYFLLPSQTFIEAIAINTDALKLAMVNGSIAYGLKHNRKNQTFLTFGFNDLINAGVVIKHWPDNC